MECGRGSLKQRRTRKNNACAKDSVERVCRLCRQPANLSLLLVGELTGKGETYVHRNCLYFGGPVLKQKKRQADKDALCGFTPESIRKEASLAENVSCCYCFQKGASVKCKTCAKFYHMPCGVKNECQFLFETCESFCLEHRHEQEPYTGSNEKISTCPICQEVLLPEVGYHQIYCPICGNWFHRDCIQTWALKAGYAFRCPSCNDEKFCETLLSNGYEIPRRDAVWEDDYREDYNALETGIYMSCSADECHCLEGRDYFDKNGGQFDLIACNTCGGAKCIHPACTDQWYAPEPWECDACEIIGFRVKASAMMGEEYRKRVMERQDIFRQQRIDSSISGESSSFAFSVNSSENSKPTSEVLVISDDDDNLSELSVVAQASQSVCDISSASSNSNLEMDVVETYKTIDDVVIID